MQMDSALEFELTGDSARWHDLAEGLTLVRASNLKLIRLQLALERHDRRAALEAIDGLVDLDRSLQERLAGMRSANQHSINDLALGIERDKLNREKLVLAAEVISKEVPAIAPPSPEAIEPTGDPGEAVSDNGEATVNAGPGWTAPQALHVIDETFGRLAQPRRSFGIIWWVIAFVVFLSAAAVIALLLDIPVAVEWLRAAREGWDKLAGF
jgi:hypothetical protein